ncbi:MAG: hypothetical protein MI740_10395 [Halanaerobiales bacterium]|nr:hypothetical protein [Halanaerobiales bacterium]
MIELVIKDGFIFFPKTSFHKTSQQDILGWIIEEHICCWLNHLNRACKSNIMEVEERSGVNPDHITLYDVKNNILLGWIEEEFRDEIEAALWEYMKVRKIGEEVSGEETGEKKRGQLSLF